ncbi:Ribonuclease 3 [Labeo rohita]|uniref:Ribonuclease 3 n=1 Tax=Labeo rohita TaxID=84645 RepID=A0ABQ8KZH2_LABRO|nr:Ribonuclease 3 [Labeo rohita]
MRLYDMSLAEVTQLMSQILTESEFNSFESAATSELQHASKADLREGVLKILKNIMGPKIDWSRITNCVQRKEETVNEYTERFCQTAVTYSGIVEDPESVLDDKGPLVCIWSDGLLAEYRKALPFLDLTWSNKTLRSNLDTLATWERDSDVKTRVKIAAASFQFNTKNQQKRKCPKREGSCYYCGKLGHWMKESDPPHYTKLVGQLVEVLTVKAVCVHAMMSSKAASPQTSMNKLHEDKESSE